MLIFFCFEESKMDYINNGGYSPLAQDVLNRSPQKYKLSMYKSNLIGFKPPQRIKLDLFQQV